MLWEKFNSSNRYGNDSQEIESVNDGDKLSDKRQNTARHSVSSHLKSADGKIAKLNEKKLPQSKLVGRRSKVSKFFRSILRSLGDVFGKTESMVGKTDGLPLSNRVPAAKSPEI